MAPCTVQCCQSNQFAMQMHNRSTWTMRITTMSTHASMQSYFTSQRANFAQCTTSTVCDLPRCGSAHNFTMIHAAKDTEHKLRDSRCVCNLNAQGNDQIHTYTRSRRSSLTLPLCVPHINDLTDLNCTRRLVVKQCSVHSDTPRQGDDNDDDDADVDFCPMCGGKMKYVFNIKSCSRQATQHTHTHAHHT